MTTSTQSTRRYDLDWLRVLSIATVFFFHSTRFFDSGGWHVKNPQSYLGVDLLVGFIVDWMMPLIFVISGVSTFYALGSRGAGRFIKDRSLRLLVPLVVGIFTHVMVQVYLERVSHHQFSGTFWDFIPQYFNGPYGIMPDGNFAWMGLHLWYLLFLFVFSLLLLPVFSWLKHRSSGQRILQASDAFLAKPLAIYLLAIPVMLLIGTLDPHSYWGMRDMGGWSLLIYLVFFAYGFMLSAHDGVQESIKRQRWLSLIAGLLLITLEGVLRVGHPEPAFDTPRFVLLNAGYGLSAWLLILAILGFGMKHLNVYSPKMAYLNEAVLPFYVLHQSVLIYVGYFVVQGNIPDLLKWLIIAPMSLAIIMALYEFLIRRINVLRFLFGMKLSRRSVPTTGRAEIPRIAHG
jgi:peptidoglycan/LPS O-acetylase OafA/YrhL